MTGSLTESATATNAVCNGRGYGLMQNTTVTYKRQIQTLP
jgi:hypothetical protein